MESIFRKGLFQDRVALITGGGTGIGLRTARELAALGATVVLAGRKQEHLDRGCAAIKADGGEVHTVICNIRDEAAVINCIEETLTKTGRLDFLVNNAGGQFPSPAEDINQKGWHAVIDTNLTGTFTMTREAFNRYFKENGGSVVNVIANMWRGFPMMAHTGAARAGVDNLTKTLAVEWGRYGVRVNAVAPGVIQSSGLARYGPEFQPLVQSTAAFNQTSRLGTEAEVAAAIVFLLSPAAAFITGETVKIDGGDSLYNPLLPPKKNDCNPPYDHEPQKKREFNHKK